MDSKKELEKLLKATCEIFIMNVTKVSPHAGPGHCVGTSTPLPSIPPGADDSGADAELHHKGDRRARPAEAAADDGGKCGYPSAQRGPAPPGTGGLMKFVFSPGHELFAISLRRGFSGPVTEYGPDCSFVSARPFPRSVNRMAEECCERPWHDLMCSEMPMGV